MVRPRFSARGRSVSVASSAMRERSTCSRVKDRWSARLSRSNASVRSIARVLTAWRRSTSSSVSRLGSLRATSRSVCVIASGVRSSWEALAANLCCSAMCASSRASMVSKASASSRNSSFGPGNWIRWESDPFAAMRVASVMRVRGASIRPARTQPSDETERQQERQHDGRDRGEAVQWVGRGCKERPRGMEMCDRTVGYVAQNDHPDGREHQDAGKHEEPGVAEGELEANTRARGSIHVPPHARPLVARRCDTRRRPRWR